MESALDKEFSKIKKKNPSLVTQKRSSNLRERRAPKKFEKVYSHEKDDENIAFLKDCYRDKMLEIDKKKAMIDAKRLAKYKEKQRQIKYGPVIVVIEKWRINERQK